MLLFLQGPDIMVCREKEERELPVVIPSRSICLWQKKYESEGCSDVSNNLLVFHRSTGIPVNACKEIQVRKRRHEKDAGRVVVSLTFHRKPFTETVEST